MTAAWARVPNERKIHGLLFVLVAVCMVAAFGGGLLAHAPTLTSVKTVQRAPSSGAALVQAWGKPDQVIDGAQISASLRGTQCAVFQARRAIVCYAP